MSKLEFIPIKAFTDNYIWCVVNREQGICACVDPGDGQAVIDYVEQQQLTLTTLLITHHHFDHTGGIQALAKRYQTRVFGPGYENIAGITDPLSDGDHIHLPDFELSLSILHTPGHTLGHIVYYNQALLFCGDTLFAAGCGRLFEGSPAQMYQSLQAIVALPGDVDIYCAHEYTQDNLRFALTVEPNNWQSQQRLKRVQALRKNDQPTLPSKMSDEISTNPFLRCHVPAVMAAAEQQANRKLTDPVDVFRVIRDWKNQFK